MAEHPDGEREPRRTTADRKASIVRVRIDIGEARREFERVARELAKRLAGLRYEMDAAKNEVDRAIWRGVGPLPGSRKYRGKWGEWPEIRPRKRRPRRGFEGGEPVPVEPKPKPKPLIDGAEAPIE